MLRYKTETRPGLVALYDIRPGNAAGQFLQPRSPRTISTTMACFWSWAAQPGGVGGRGQCPPPHFWDQRGTGGYRRAVQWKWFLLLQQTIFIQYCTSDWISTPLTLLVDTLQVNDIRKDGLGRVSTVHSHWTAAMLHYSNLHANKYSLVVYISRKFLNSNLTKFL